MKDATSWQVRYAVVVGIVIAALGLAALGVSSLLVGAPKPGDACGIVYYLLPLAVVGLLYLIVRPANAFTNFAHQPAASYRYGWYLVMVAIIVGVLTFFSIPEGRLQTPTLLTVVIYLIVTILTATFEELLCRGLIQNVIVTRYRDTALGPWGAIVISSLIFAAMHVANLTVKPWLVVGTATQVIYTACVGILVGTIYYLTGDLLAPIIVHAAFNFFGSLALIFQPASDPAKVDLSVGGALIQIVLILPALVIARRLYQRSIATTQR